MQIGDNLVLTARAPTLTPPAREGAGEGGSRLSCLLVRGRPRAATFFTFTRGIRDSLVGRFGRTTTSRSRKHKVQVSQALGSRMAEALSSPN
jgi:hypothetical protein